MPDFSIILMVIAIGAAPLVAAYWLLRYSARKKQARLLRQPRPWQLPTIQRWVTRGWLDPELTGLLPQELPPADVFWVWAAADPEAALYWRFKEKLQEATPCETLVCDAWASIPAGVQSERRERLAEAVRIAARPYAGAERGWNGRPYVVLAADLPRKTKYSLPLEAADDLTAAQVGGPLDGEAMAGDSSGPDLVLALFALRRSSLRCVHPLAPRQGGQVSLISGLSTRVGSDVGRRIGGGLGAALGPIGSMIGQYLGGVAGELGGKAIAGQTLPSPVTDALKSTEAALASLGSLTASPDLPYAAALPEEAILETGRRLEPIRNRRSKSFREGIWPSLGLVVVEETLRSAIQELRLYREAAAQFVAIARRAAPAVAGGLVLQNPWLVHRLPGAVERLNAARQSLNRAASALRRFEDRG